MAVKSKKQASKPTYSVKEEKGPANGTKVLKLMQTLDGKTRCIAVGRKNKDGSIRGNKLLKETYSKKSAPSKSEKTEDSDKK